LSRWYEEELNEYHQEKGKFTNEEKVIIEQESSQWKESLPIVVRVCYIRDRIIHWEQFEEMKIQQALSPVMVKSKSLNVTMDDC